MNKEVLREAALRHPTEIMPPYDAINEQSGFDAVCAFAEHFSGLSIYVPNARTIFAGCLEREIRNGFTGNNFVSLSRKYGYTERHIRRMLGNP